MYKLLIAFYCAVMLGVLLDAEGSYLNMIVRDVDDLDLGKPKPPKNITNFTLALRKYHDSEFYGSVRLGGRGQELKVVFDTAWATSWVMSKDCSASVLGCHGHELYDHERSTMYVRNGTRFYADEGSYNMTGYYSLDQINFGGVSLNMTFVEMTQVPPSFADDKADGVIGLAPSSNGVKTFPEMLYEKGLIKQPVFCIYINRDFQSDRGGDIMIGAINGKHIHVTNKEKDKLTFVRVDDSKGRWAFKMDGVAMIKAKKSIPFCLHDCNTFIDTGSIYIYVPKAAIDQINYYIHASPENGRNAIACDTIRKLPPINFIIGGQNFTLKGIDYVQKVTEGNVVKCYSVFMQGTTSSEKSGWILGASFLARYFSVYNFQTKVIGFVRAA